MAPSLYEGGGLLGQPWCQNWLNVLNDGAEPVDVLPQFKRGFRSGSSHWTKSKAGKSATAMSEVLSSDEEEKEKAAIEKMKFFEQSHHLE